MGRKQKVDHATEIATHPLRGLIGAVATGRQFGWVSAMGSGHHPHPEKVEVRFVDGETLFVDWGDWTKMHPGRPLGVRGKKPLDNDVREGA